MDSVRHAPIQIMFHHPAIIEKRRESGLETHIVFIHFTTALDTVNREKQRNIMIQHG